MLQRSRLPRRHAAALLLALVGWGCAAPETSPSPQEPEPGPSTPGHGEVPDEVPDPVPVWDPAGSESVVSNDGTYLIRYRLPEDGIPLNEDFGLEVAVYRADAPDIVLRDVRAHVDAAMPHHFHGMTQFSTVEAQEDGSFEVEAMRFHMPGRWEMYVDVTEGAVTERAQFWVELD